VIQSTATEHLLWLEFVKMTCTYRAPPTQPLEALSHSNIASLSHSNKQESAGIDNTQQVGGGQYRRSSRTIQSTGGSGAVTTSWNSSKAVNPVPSSNVTTTSPPPGTQAAQKSPPAPTFGPLVDYLTLEAQQGRHVVKLCDLGVQKEIPWRKYYMKLKSYIEAAARLGFVTMIYLPNNQIGVCLTDKCHFTLIRKIQKLVQDLPYILEQMKIQFLAPVEQNLQNVVKSRFGFRTSPHHWEIFLQCLQCCGYQVIGPTGKRSIIGLLGNFDGFDPSEPKHTLQGEALQEFEDFLVNSRTDNEGGFAWNSNSGRFGFVTDLLQVGPPLIRATPSGVLLSHIQIMLNKRTLGYNKDNKICRAEYIDQPANVNIDLSNFRQKLENALAPHSTLLHPLIELQVAAPLVRDFWKSLGFSKMKHCLKYAEENGILLCDWKMRDDTSQPWIALSSSVKPLASTIETHFEQTGEDFVDSNIIKSKLERKYGYIRANSWKDILTVATRYPSINLKQECQNYIFLKKTEQKETAPSEDLGSSNTASEISVSTVDSNTEDELSQPSTTSSLPRQYHFEEPILEDLIEEPLDEQVEEEAPEFSFHTDLHHLQQQFRTSLHIYDKLSPEHPNYTSIGYPTTAERGNGAPPNTIGSGLHTNNSSNRSEPKYLDNNQSMFHTSPFEIIDGVDDRGVETDEDENLILDNDSFRNRSSSSRNEEKCLIQ